MTAALLVAEIANKVGEKLPGSIREVQESALVVNPADLPEVMLCLKNGTGLDMDYLTAVTATDYWEYFEIVYILASLKHNHTVWIKTRLPGRHNLSLPSIVSIYRAADYQEREISELLGIRFEGHPDPRPLLLWEGFKGFPLRKDYL